MKEKAGQKRTEINIITLLEFVLLYKVYQSCKKITSACVAKEKTHKAETTSANAVKVTSPMPLLILMLKISIVLKKNMLKILKSQKENS